jgi:L-alanine-DL-glutamate epimerase-like enolase superfamily enzyme
MSPDDASSCETALRELTAASLPALSPAAPLLALADAGERFSHLPAARCAIEAALLDLAAQARGEPAWATLRAHLPAASPLGSAVPVAALLQALDAAGRLAEAERAVARGVRTLKMKVGRPGEFAAERAELEALRARFGSSIALRVDANRAWSAEAALAHLETLAGIDPEFVEEPTADWHGLERSPERLALDESLSTPELLPAVLRRREALQLTVCVLKPTLLGGIVPVLRLVDTARQAGLGWVISHAFEGPLAFALASALALATMDGRRAAGLAGYPLLESWAARPAWLQDASILPWDGAGWGLPIIEPPAGE